MVYHSISKELEKMGVLLMDMDSALREHPDIVRKYFGKIIPTRDNKFSALNTSVWSGGSFIYVPKGVKVDPGALHMCYCHTPMRYIWDRFDDYFGAGSGSRIPRPVARGAARRLRRWDALSAEGVTGFLANSRHVAGRIERYYGRPATVIPPPVDTDRFQPGDGIERLRLRGGWLGRSGLRG